MKLIRKIKKSTTATILRIWQLFNRLPPVRALAHVLPKKTIHTATSSLSRRKYITKRKLAAIFVIIIAILLTNTYINSQKNKPSSDEQTTSIDTADKPPTLQKGTPDYTTLAPKGVSIDSLGGWTRVSPPDRNPVFAYVQMLGESTISVSQQILPESLQTNTQEGLSALAKDFRANELITAGDTPVYIETKNNGAQSVIFVKKDLLILIKSSRNVGNDVWKEYIVSLE